MPTFNRYSVYPCRLGDLLLRDLTSVEFRSASKKSIVIPGGALTPQAIVNCASDPMLSLTTKDLAGIFGGSPSISLSLGYAITVSGMSSSILQFQKRADGSSFLAAGSAGHTVGTNNKGFVSVSEISAQQDDEEGARATLDYHLLSVDGLSDPMTFSNATALSSTPNYNGIWYLGPVKYGVIGGALTSLLGVQSVSIRPGIDYRSPRADGDVYPISGSIHAIVPEIRIVVLDLAGKTNLLSTPWGKAFSTGGATSWNIWFQKGVHGGGRVAAATAEHIVVVANTGDETMDSISVSKLDDGRLEIIIRPSSSVLSLTSGIAIT